MNRELEKSSLREQAIEKLVDLTLAAGSLEGITDKYFTRARRVAEIFGDKEVVYAIFLRRHVIAALEPVVRLLARLVPDAKVTRFFSEGELVPSERKILEISGSYAQLSEVETLVLQKVGFPCVCANNAYNLCRSMPTAAFIDMHARHATGPEMSLMASYGASVGSLAAKRSENSNVSGFIGSSQDLTAPFFDTEYGMGTIPHALVGYAGGDIVVALDQFVEALPQQKSVIALVDYRGQETTDALRAANWFFNEKKFQKSEKTLSIRLDTHGGRFAEGLDYETSVQIVGEWLGVVGEYNIVEYVMGRNLFQMDHSNMLIDQVRRILFGKGVSVASVIRIRRQLDSCGFTETEIVVSSGFDTFKCVVSGAAHAPIDVVGTGSYLPHSLQETYATADVISYDGQNLVKLGRERLFAC